MRMTASFGPSILGVPRSSNRMSPGPQSTAPLMVRLLVPLVCSGSDAWSLHRHPAVDDEGMADHVARPGTAEPEHRRSYFPGPGYSLLLVAQLDGHGLDELADLDHMLGALGVLLEMGR